MVRSRSAASSPTSPSHPSWATPALLGTSLKVARHRLVKPAGDQLTCKRPAPATPTQKQRNARECQSKLSCVPAQGYLRRNGLPTQAVS
eukprot:15454728-Alexandrium_andersonii.AAC.1